MQDIGAIAEVVEVVDPARFFETVFRVATRNLDAIEALSRAPNIFPIAMQILIWALLSQTIGQSIILFANRVKPVRFTLSLLLSTMIYLMGALIFTTLTWFIARFFFDGMAPYQRILTAVALAHTPLLLGFLGFIPILGQIILRVVEIYMYILVAFSLSAILGFDLLRTALVVAGAAIILEMLRRSIGHPVLVGVNLFRQRPTRILETVDEVLPLAAQE